MPVPAKIVSVWWVLVSAFFEELVFRGWLQDAVGKWLTKQFPNNWYAQSSWKTTFPGTANLIVSGLFCLLHLYSHPPLWALGVMLPSLALGVIWDRHQSVSLCWLIHATYNICYFYRPL